MPKSRSLRDLLETISQQENVSFAGNDILPPVETPNIGTPSLDKELAAEVVGGAIEGFKEKPDDTLANRAKAAASKAGDAFLDDENIKAVIDLFR